MAISLALASAVDGVSELSENKRTGDGGAEKKISCWKSPASPSSFRPQAYIPEGARLEVDQPPLQIENPRSPLN